ncbi:MAG: peptidase M19 [Alphaproteobacteria bacterium]|nr:peptidase M19 [Alphaproteobacteria bacterium]
MKSSALHADALIWDAHACLPLSPLADVSALARHKAAGVDYVSINIGMDMNPIEQVMATLAAFRAQVQARPDLFRLVESGADVERARTDGVLALGFDLEGGLPLLGRAEMVVLFGALGVRQIHLAYNRNNALCGGCYDLPMGLTALGREIVAAINAAGILMDCSHTGEKSAFEIIEASNAPVVFSHSNPRAVSNDKRNIADSLIDACALRGGVVCANGVGRFLDDPEAGTPSILRAIDYLVTRIGPRHVGIGLDYSYSQGIDDDPPGLNKDYWWPRAEGYSNGINIRIATPEQWPEITEGLVKLGYAEADIRAILGGNMLALAKTVWRR